MRPALGRPRLQAGLAAAQVDAGKRLEQTVANMRTTMLQYALTAGLGGMLALGAVTGRFGPVRTGPDATSQVTQYCAPEQNSDAPDAPRCYCGNGHAHQPPGRTASGGLARSFQSYTDDDRT
jgi:hypothetical protein